MPLYLCGKEYPGGLRPFEQNIANVIQHLYYLFDHFVGTPPQVRSSGDPQAGEARYLV